MATVQQVIDRARVNLHDAAKTRWADVTLLTYAQDAVSIALSIRPDLRYGSYGIAAVALTLGGTFPLPLQHEAAAIEYITYRAENPDDEHVNEGREQKSYARYIDQITKI
jgi:hypothetical protein